MAQKADNPYQYEYEQEPVSSRIEARRKELGIPVKVIAEEIWPDQGSNARYSWYKKTKGLTSSWEPWETKRAAQIMRASPGWPYVDWNYAEALRQANRNTKG